MAVYNTFVKCSECNDFETSMWVDGNHEARMKKAIEVAKKLGIKCPVCGATLIGFCNKCRKR